MDNFKKFLEKLISFNPKETDVFISLFFEQDLKKGDYLAKAGEYSTKLAFLKSGIMRAFYRNSNGKEYNKTFFIENSFVAAYSSLITKQKNLINIECLTNCKILISDFKEINKLYDSYPKIESLARILAERKFTIKEKREVELVTLDAADRYKIFQKEYPNLENLVPQYHIASYLGVSPTQLSRIRSKK
ncbi:Crp/Fnr family transcriptional regulator [Yeosuana marina]|uniref:Crp/Fnr family transcriptional regulator n=1 Tax=Yeosuana marina TaxID=1565536 RepID=UPI0014219F06|nr:Crp/Fnr family transcriptional regulator [Yeosuana marina]